MSDNTVPMPTRARMKTLEAVRSATGGDFDAEAWHVIEQRDNALISDEILNGSGSNKFVYSFSVSGKEVAGISVIGARHLAAAYGGIKHRMIASVQKIGALHTFTSYPQPGMPMNVQCAVVSELEGEDDYYGAIVEISDIKTGNSIQVEKRETRYERRRDGSKFERPHYSVIAQSKAYRNGVLAIISQDVQMKWKLEMLTLGKEDVITTSVMDEKRAGILRFAASKGQSVDRRAIEALTIPQISGLSDAAKSGLNDFMSAARSLNVMGGDQEPVQVATQARAAQPPAAVQQAAAQSDRPRQEAKAPAPTVPTFEAYVIDAEGEVAGDLMRDAGLWAEAFVEVFRDATDKAVVLENNADAIAAARAFPSAAGLLSNLSVTPAAPAGPDHYIPLKITGRGPDFTTYIKAAAASYTGLDEVGRAQWVEVNEPTFRPFPATYRPFSGSKWLEAMKAASAPQADPAPAAKAVSPAPQDLLLDTSKPAEGASADELWAGDLVGTLPGLISEASLLSLVARSRVRMDAVMISDPALWKRVSGAFEERMAQLKVKPPADDAGPHQQDGDPGHGA